MEVQLRKPQREIFNLLNSSPGSFIRRHKKSLTHTRTYWRVMDKEYNPVKNITQSRMRPLFDAEILTEIREKEFTLKPDVVLAEKKKKESKKK